MAETRMVMGIFYAPYDGSYQQLEAAHKIDLTCLSRQVVLFVYVSCIYFVASRSGKRSFFIDADELLGELASEEHISIFVDNRLKLTAVFCYSFDCD